jgi:FdhD protein
MSTTDPSTAKVGVARFVGSGGASAEDTVVVEEPLEIRVSGDTIAVTMRTPGHERDLALGFLFSEGLVRAADDVASVAFCGRPGDENLRNTLEITPRAGGWLERAPRDPVRRGTVTSAACGVCGRVQIDDLLERLPALTGDERLPIGVVTAAVRALRGEQALFAKTGGCHGAGLFRFDGAHVATREDVGRHNAVDKVVGAMLAQGAVPLAGHLLVVSGRASFEIVQKAANAGVPVVACVSAPSSLAVTLAQRAGITLVGFVRGENCNVYTHAYRVAD